MTFFPIKIVCLACENSHPSSLPVRVGFSRNATRAASEEGRLFSQAVVCCANKMSQTLFLYVMKAHM